MSLTPTIHHLPHRPGTHWPTRTTLWQLDYQGDPITWWPHVPEWRQPHRVRVDIDTLLDPDAPEWLAHTFFQETETADKHVFEVITTRPTQLRTIIVDREQHKRDYADAFDNHLIPTRRSSPAAAPAPRPPATSGSASSLPTSTTPTNTSRPCSTPPQRYDSPSSTKPHPSTSRPG